MLIYINFSHFLSLGHFTIYRLFLNSVHWISQNSLSSNYLSTDFHESLSFLVQKYEKRPVFKYVSWVCVAVLSWWKREVVKDFLSGQKSHVWVGCWIENGFPHMTRNINIVNTFHPPIPSPHDFSGSGLFKPFYSVIVVFTCISLLGNPGWFIFTMW